MSCVSLVERVVKFHIWRGIPNGLAIYVTLFMCMSLKRIVIEGSPVQNPSLSVKTTPTLADMSVHYIDGHSFMSQPL